MSAMPIEIANEKKIHETLMWLICLDAKQLRAFVKKYSAGYSIKGGEATWRAHVDDAIEKAIKNTISLKSKSTRSLDMRNAAANGDMKQLAQTVANISRSWVDKNTSSLGRLCGTRSEWACEQNVEMDIDNEEEFANVAVTQPMCEATNATELYLRGIIGGERVKKSKKIQQIWRIV